MNKVQLREKILALVGDYYHAANPPEKFIPGTTRVPYAGRVFDEREMQTMCDSLLDFWLTLGRYNDKFETVFSQVTHLKHTIVVNSGSSANLLAVSALMSNQRKDKLKRGDEVITCASTFPTTLNPIIQNGLRPVFLDVELGTYNMELNHLSEAISDKTKAIMIPHVLGNPNDMGRLCDFAGDHGLYLIEDCCDALGSKYRGNSVGTFGDLATFSFFPAHHITMGEGGAVGTNDASLSRTVVSLRDWGRDCHCTHSNDSNGACKNRFNYQIDGKQYDHRYAYSNIGYNLKPLDLQCAMGVEQVKKIPKFAAARKRNFKILYDGLSGHQNSLMLPEATEHTSPSWFAFPISVISDKFTRLDLMQWLENRNIMTRMLFTGNILKHPAYAGLDCRVIGDLRNSDFVMDKSFFVGVYPGLTEEMVSYIADSICQYVDMWI